jgi:GNAT superfamily N-acetyltransferase
MQFKAQHDRMNCRSKKCSGPFRATEASMQNITFEIVRDGNIEQCRELCNELMRFQQSQAVLHPEKFGYMNFDTRMKSRYESSIEKQVIVAKDNGTPIGYVFTTIDTVKKEEKPVSPELAPLAENTLGFYPDWVKLPQKIGCLNNLYLKDEYRHLGLGDTFIHMSMEWFDRLDDGSLIFVYTSNGNDTALRFYLKHGFIFSHDVFGGFLRAAYQTVRHEQSTCVKKKNQKQDIKAKYSRYQMN